MEYGKNAEKSQEYQISFRTTIKWWTYLISAFRVPCGRHHNIELYQMKVETKAIFIKWEISLIISTVRVELSLQLFDISL